MDKEILIDGVNVAECIHIFNEENKSKTCYIDETYCVDNPNCYFKQLAREKQKNKELENKLKALQI